MSHKTENFLGGWKLVGWEIQYPDGKITYPFGENPVGQILYSADGQMSATVRHRDRAELSKGNPRNVTSEDKARAFESYFHYAGSWKIDGESVVHNVEMSLNPNMTGSDQVRHAAFQTNGDLILSADEPIADNEKRHHALTWRRSL